MVKAIYAFSGDPITYGHIDIINRASRVFDEVIVAIGINPDKNYLFSLQQREEMARVVLLGMPNVVVVSFEGMLVDFAYENDVSVIVKGVRNSTDMNYESVLHQVGESQKLGIDTFIMVANSKLGHISSSIVKDISRSFGDLSGYVPSYVKRCLDERIHEQYILGVTGEVASGKSYFAESFVEYGVSQGIDIHNIDLDKLGHEILCDSNNNHYEVVRSKVVKEFGVDVQLPDGTINRKVLGEIVFNEIKKLELLNDIMRVPLIVRLRRELRGKKGILLINAALLCEMSLLSLCSNNVVLLNVDKNVQKQRLLDRKLNDSQIDRRIESQYSFDEKKRIVEHEINSSKCGELFELDGSVDNFKKSFDEIIRFFDIS